MTNTVIQLTHCVDMETISRLFVKYKGRYGGLWTCRAASDQEWRWVMEDWLEELRCFSLDVLRLAFKKSLIEFEQAPPTLSQLVHLCIQESGAPDVQEVIRLMIDREFSHPLVKMVYDKIGSWTLSNGKEDEIQRKAKEYYDEALSSFHIEPQKEWAKLETYNNRQKELPPPTADKQDSKPYITFKQRLAEYQELVEAAKLTCDGEEYTKFPDNCINPRHKDFDPVGYAKYRDYLLSIPETKTMILPTEYIYDRGRFINMREQPAYLQSLGCKLGGTTEGPQQHRHNRAKKAYKSWTDDE